MAITDPIELFSSEGDELFSRSRVRVEEEDPPPTLRAVAPLPPLRLATSDASHVEYERVYEQAAEHDDDEPVPETLRSSVLVRVHEPVSRPIVIEMEEDHRAA